jgi:hypothetical protein
MLVVTMLKVEQKSGRRVRRVARFSANRIGLSSHLPSAASPCRQAT